MEKHDCQTIQDRFSKRHFCFFCKKEFIAVEEKDRLINEVYLDIYNLIVDENYPLATTEGVVVYLKSKICNN